MSYNKFRERSYYDIKDQDHKDKWMEEIREALVRSSSELGIYNREEVENKIRELQKEILEKEEFRFIEGLKEIEGIGVYAVGGPIRDKVLGKQSKDIDLIIDKINPADLIEKLSQYGDVIFDRNPNANLMEMDRSKLEELVLNNYGVLKFKPNNSKLKELIDIAFPRKDNHSNSGTQGIQGIKRDAEVAADPNLNISEDLARRDLTINAIALNLINGDIADPFDGIDDIIKKEVRAVGEPKERILNEDLSRGFRAIRFACVLGGKLEEKTKKVVQEIFKPSEKSSEDIYNDPETLKEVLEYEKTIRKEFNISEGNMPRCLQVFWDKELKKPRLAVAKDVMGREIIKSLKANPLKLMELLEDTGGLKILFPELERLKGLAQPREYHMEGDVFKHTKLLLKNLPRNGSLKLVLAGLCHDLGKFDTYKNDDGMITFNGHAEKGADYIYKMAERFNYFKELTKKTVDEISWLIKNHMFPLSENVKNIRSKKLEDMFFQNEELGRELISLSQADALASKHETGESSLENINFLIERLEKIKAKIGDVSEMKMPLIITGKDLIEIGLQPGPQFKEILELVRDAQLDGRIKSKEEGLELVKNINIKID